MNRFSASIFNIGLFGRALTSVLTILLIHAVLVPQKSQASTAVRCSEALTVSSAQSSTPKPAITELLQEAARELNLPYLNIEALKQLQNKDKKERYLAIISQFESKVMNSRNPIEQQRMKIEIRKMLVALYREYSTSNSGWTSRSGLENKVTNLKTAVRGTPWQELNSRRLALDQTQAAIEQRLLQFSTANQRSPWVQSLRQFLRDSGGLSKFFGSAALSHILLGWPIAGAGTDLTGLAIKNDTLSGNEKIQYRLWIDYLTDKAVRIAFVSLIVVKSVAFVSTIETGVSEFLYERASEVATSVNIANGISSLGKDEAKVDMGKLKKSMSTKEYEDWARDFEDRHDSPPDPLNNEIEKRLWVVHYTNLHSPGN